MMRCLAAHLCFAFLELPCFKPPFQMGQFFYKRLMVCLGADRAIGRGLQLSRGICALPVACISLSAKGFFQFRLLV